MDSTSAAELLVAGTPPHEVSRQCGLRADFVDHVQSALIDSAYIRRSSFQESLSSDQVLQRFQGLAKRYLLTIFLSSLGVGALIEVFQFLRDRKMMMDGAIGPAITLTLIAAVLLFQCLLFAHMGVVRRALWAYPFFYVGVVALPNLVTIKGSDFISTIVGGLLAFVALAPVYYMFAVPSAALGGYARIRNQSLRQNKLSRQQMLEQLFELRARRSGAVPSEALVKSRFTGPFFQKLGRQVFLKAAIMSALIAITTMALVLLFDPKGNSLTGAPSFWLGISQLVLMAISVTSLVLVSIAAGSPVRALLAAFIFSVVPLAVYTIPAKPFGIGYITSPTALFGAVFGLVFYNIIALATSLAVMIHINSKRTEALTANQPDVLDQEIGRLQESLSPPSRRICVMDVDAYQSSRMKQENDPFESEWSFREYQAMISRVVARYLGVVHSTAGDGAIVGFPTSADALRASIALQAEIAVFNVRVNRLNVPFRIRIGLHTGQVQGSLDEIQFTEVIDVAAHVQKAVPVGTIGVTNRTMEHLDQHMFSAAGMKVDGYDVYVVDHVRGPRP
ncbi:MAG: hypothetical protein JNJ45_07415 [Chthonomonas sp.]|nr:hypothetical protein [Chthonomonas sp.]